MVCFLIVSFHESRKSMRLARNTIMIAEAILILRHRLPSGGGGGRGGATAVFGVWSENAM